MIPTPVGGVGIRGLRLGFCGCFCSCFCGSGFAVLVHNCLESISKSVQRGLDASEELRDKNFLRGDICELHNGSLVNDLTVEVAGENLEGQALFDAVEKMRAETMAGMPAVSISLKKKEASAPAEAFYGKVCKGKTVPMKELTL